MRRGHQTVRVSGVVASVAGLLAVAAWALGHSSAQLAPAVFLLGIVGVGLFAAALVGKRGRTIVPGLSLVGACAAVGALHEGAGVRAGVLAVSGAVLFCAAEVADRTLDRTRAAEDRLGVARWSPGWVLGVATLSACVAFGAGSARNIVAGGGPAALAAGTAASVLVAVLAALVLRLRSRPGT